MLNILAGIVAVIILIADQITKSYVVSNFMLSETRTFIPGIIDFTYVHNKGGAWGLMNGHTWILISLTLLIMVICVAMVFKNGFKSKLLFWAVSLILSGGIGNMVDRIARKGVVIDFLHLHFMPTFPVFNVADCAVCIGAGLLILFFLMDIFKEHKKTKLRAVELTNGTDKNQ